MKTQTLFYHGTSTDGNRFTIAGEYKDSDLLLAISICSKDDQFIKRTGRNKSEGRLVSESFKGCKIVNLYSTSYFKPTNESGTFDSDWFEGKQTDTFVNLCSEEFEKYSSKELKSHFHLNQ